MRNSSRIIVGNINTPLSIMGRTLRQKINKEIEKKFKKCLRTPSVINQSGVDDALRRRKGRKVSFIPQGNRKGKNSY